MGQADRTDFRDNTPTCATCRGKENLPYAVAHAQQEELTERNHSLRRGLERAGLEERGTDSISELA